MKDTAVLANTTREQGLAFRDTRGSQLPLLLPSRLPTNLKLVSSTSWKPQADKPLTDKPKQATWTSHKKGSGTKAPQPRVERRRRGATLGILNLLGSGYEFQGWHFSEKRERGNDSGWQSLTRVCRTHHELLRSFGVMRHAQPASARADAGATHCIGSRTPAGQHVTARPIFLR